MKRIVVVLGVAAVMAAALALLAGTALADTTGTRSPLPNEHGWNNSDVTVTLNSTGDTCGGCGIKEIRYFALGAQSIPETVYDPQNPPLINTEGFTSITAYAIYDNGGQEFPKKKVAGVSIDKTPPEVSSTYPLRYDTRVYPDGEILAGFAPDLSFIDPNTVTTDTFKVAKVKPTGNVPVSGTVRLEHNNPDFTSQTAFFDPLNSLDKGLYQATITTGVKDNAGNALAKNYTWTF